MKIYFHDVEDYLGNDSLNFRVEKGGGVCFFFILQPNHIEKNDMKDTKYDWPYSAVSKRIIQVTFEKIR